MKASDSIFHRLTAHLVSLEWLLLVLMLPLVLFPTRERLPVLLIIPALWFARRLTAGRFVPATPVDWPLFILLCMVTVSLFVTPDPEASMPKVAGMVFGIAIFYAAVAQLQISSRRLWFGIGMLLLSGLAVVAVSLLATRWTGKLPILGELVARLPQARLSLPGTIDGAINPNEISGVLLWITPLAIFLAWTSVKRLRTSLPPWQMGPILLFTVATAVLLTAMLLLAQSRGGLLGLGVAIGFLVIFSFRTDWRWVVVALFIVLLLVAGTVAVLGTSAVSNILFDPANNELAGNVADTLEGRLEIWSRALYAIQDFPLTGMGMNTFRRVVHLLYPLFLITPNIDIAHAHNQFLQTALDLGLPGLVAFLALWMGSAGMLWRVWRLSSDEWRKTLVLGFGASLIGYFVFGLTDAVALGARPGFVFWLLLGLIAGLHDRVSAHQLTPGGATLGDSDS